MTYTEEQLKKMIHMGILGYPVEKCINILDIESKDESQFISDFNSPQSELAKAYQKGKDKGEYQIDMKLYQKATEGDMKALQKYEERKAYQNR